jgi:hypothetical protein
VFILNVVAMVTDALVTIAVKVFVVPTMYGDAILYDIAPLFEALQMKTS